MAGNEVQNNNKLLLIHLISDILSSSSDSDEDDIFINAFMIKRQRRRKPKVANFIETVVHNYTDIEFKQNFRITRDTCELITEKFRNSEFYPKKEHNSGGKPTISAEKHVLVFMWFAGNKCVIREVSQLFDLSESSVHVVCERVINYFVSVAEDIIKFPKTHDELQEAATDFEEIAGFPNVIGCIDGSYINMRTPVHKLKSTYVNRHHQTSLTLQGICDASKRFIDVFTGTSGKIHDSRVFSYSFIRNTLPAICGHHFHILGDSAYPISEYLLTPYRDYGNLTAPQRRFNNCFSSTRVLIENAFGLLKGRFRQLIHQVDFHTVLKTSKFILSCCVLHNLCIDNGDMWEDMHEDVNELVPLDQHQGVIRRLGEQKRDHICAAINNL